jgi:hypothetical protein
LAPVSIQGVKVKVFDRKGSRDKIRSIKKLAKIAIAKLDAMLISSFYFAHVFPIT